MIHLLTPPYYPEYNGAVESGTGVLKTYAFHEAAKDGLSGAWTSDHIEAARLRSNEVTRPHGAKGPSPDEMFDSRKAISADERKTFIETVAVYEEEAREVVYSRTRSEAGTEILDARTDAKIRRESIARALVALGYLLVRRRRITPPVFSKKWEIFTR